MLLPACGPVVDDAAQADASAECADAVLVRRVDGSVVEAFVVEVQLQPDARKHFSWPHYVTGLRARLECPVTLVVFATDERTAEWCARPIELGRRSGSITPLVIGPSQVPRITDPEDATSPELAVVSAIAHAGSSEPSEAAAVSRAALTAIARLDDARHTLYADVVLAALAPAARAFLEAEMRIEGYEFKTDFLREAFAEGKQEGVTDGARRVLLAILDARGLVLSADDLDRIARCADEEQLEAWARRAVAAQTVDELFA